MAIHHLCTEPGPPIVLSADPFRFMPSAASEPLLGTGNLLSLGTLCLESVYFSDPPFCGLAGCPPVLPGSRPQVPVVPDPVGLSLPAPARGAVFCSNMGGGHCCPGPASWAWIYAFTLGPRLGRAAYLV